jgi:hypothetical protein
MQRQPSLRHKIWESRPRFSKQLNSIVLGCLERDQTSIHAEDVIKCLSMLSFKIVDDMYEAESQGGIGANSCKERISIRECPDQWKETRKDRLVHGTCSCPLERLIQASRYTYGGCELPVTCVIENLCYELDREIGSLGSREWRGRRQRSGLIRWRQRGGLSVAFWNAVVDDIVVCQGETEVTGARERSDCAEERELVVGECIVG